MENIFEFSDLFGLNKTPFDNWLQNKPTLPPPKIKTNSSKCTCKQFFKANSFKSLVELVKSAEEMLIKNGLDDIGDRINCIRGIYYGAVWSLDFQQEKSANRNRGFYIYTTFRVENDARKLLKCSDNCNSNLFNALYQSPEVVESYTRVTDFGHLMIGLDARRSYISRFVNLPYGGTGLENVTWIGDIGGGAGMLAYKRVTNPIIRAKKLVFDSLHDYGCSVNIEGDIAGYVTGRDEIEWKDISNPEDNMEYIYKGLENYFSKPVWTSRVNSFLGMLGAEFENGALKNRDEVLEGLIDSVEGFAQFYIAIRVIDNNKDKDNLIKSFGYIKSCSKEVSEIFLDAVLDLRTHPNSYKFRAVTDPEPTIVDNFELENASKKANEIIEKVKKMLTKVY